MYACVLVRVRDRDRGRDRVRQPGGDRETVHVPLIDRFVTDCLKRPTEESRGESNARRGGRQGGGQTTHTHLLHENR